MGTTSRRWKFGWCEYAEMSRALVVHGRRSELRGKPLDVLQLLLKHAETVVPNETLIRLVWGNASRQSLTVAISKLRKAFGGGLDDLIQNVSAEGYRMAVPVHLDTREETGEPLLQLRPGEPILRNASWIAVTRLGGPEHGPVWLTRDKGTGEERVYKFATDGVRLRTLQREETVAAILGRSGSPPSFLRRIDDWNFSEWPYFLAGEYVGKDLLAFSGTAEFLNMSRQERVALVAMLCDAVAAAHAVGVLHNDLKPSNVLVRSLAAPGNDAPLNQRYAMVLIDFGDSTLLNEALTGSLDQEDSDDLFDTPGASSVTTNSEMYRAPELRLGQTVSVEADVYSLGVILYQTVLGDFQHTPAAGWQQELGDALLEEDIARAAHREPQGRFRTAAAMAEQLQSLEARRTAAAERERERMHAMQVQRDLDRARAARPWIAAALVAMAMGVLISGWFFRSAVRQRNLAQQENRSLEAMLTFLSEDVLAQNNPAAAAGASHTVDLTLADAIRNAETQVERRFPHDPKIASRLHETIADGLRARTQFVEADMQYRVAAEGYRALEGPLSQGAIAVELKRDATRLSGLLPGSVEEARRSFDQQKKLIAQLRQPSPVVLTLEDFVESGLLGLEADPSKALPLLQRAISRAEATSGFDPMLLLWIKGRYCGLYVRLQDGPRLQAAAEDRIREISARFGEDSPMLVSYQMYLQEAYFLQGSYGQAIQQADRNYPRFQRLLGGRNQYTLAVLANRAASLAQLGRYAEAVDDDMRLYNLEGEDASGVRLKIGSLSDAALYACRSGHFDDGLERAQRVLQASAPGPTSMPGFYNGAKFILAECTLDKQEATGQVREGALDTSRMLLRQVNPTVIVQQTGDQGYAAFVDLAIARIAVLERDHAAAKQSLARVDGFFAQPGCDPFELQQYRRVKQQLADTSGAKGERAQRKESGAESARRPG